MTRVVPFSSTVPPKLFLTMEEIFASCSLFPVTGLSPNSAAPSILSVVPSDSTTQAKQYKTTAFYEDNTSGRYVVALPLELRFSSSENLETFVKSGCWEEIPEDKSSAPDSKRSEWSLGIEAKVGLTFGTGSAVSAAVEHVAIVQRSQPSSQKPEGSASLLVDAEVCIQVHGWKELSTEESMRVKSILEVTAVLSSTATSATALSTDAECYQERNLHSALSLLNGVSVDSARSLSSRSRSLRLSPVTLQVAATYAFSVDVRSTVLQESPHKTGLKNLAVVTIRHSNTHQEDLTVSHLTIHPEKSLVVHRSADGNVASGIERYKDMADILTWSFAPFSGIPSLPFILRPNEAFAVSLLLDGSIDERSRSFLSPLLVTSSVTLPVMRGTKPRCREVVAASRVQWTSACRATFQPTDSFRVSLRLVSNPDRLESGPTDPSTGDTLSSRSFTAGIPFGVQVSLENLGVEPRNIQIEVLDEPSSDSESLARDEPKFESSSAMIVAPVTPPVDTDFSARGWTKPQFLVTIDETADLGVVPSKSTRSEAAVLRFVPTRSGAYKIPPLRLIDRLTDQSYYCFHSLCAFVDSSQP
jgi:hypothetical protein